jgi:hypothetical protein
MGKYGFEKVAMNVQKAISIFMRKDLPILEHDLNERTISHRLAMYLQRLFPTFNVDCEYNRDHDDAKMLFFPADLNNNVLDTNAKTVYPDIIVHHRGDNDHNLLVIEIKKSSRGSESAYFDMEKLQLFHEQYCYHNCLFMQIPIGHGDLQNWGLNWI